jgi:hypothetical protein
MPRIELTITTDYLSSWGAWEGLRELVQNGKDAETEFEAKLSIDWYNNTVRIENEGAVLPHEALLFGFSTKREREDLIGKFGEGLKLGVLALVRAGYPVKIRSGSEVWTPEIVQSDKFNAKVLAFDIQGGRKDEKRVRVEVGNIDKETWDKLKLKILFLGKLKDTDVVHAYHGDLLLDEEMKGQLYVKGIWVQSKPDMLYGYNFNDATLDRDRRMIESYDLNYKAKSIYAEAAGRRPDLLPGFMAALDCEAPDIAGISEVGAMYLPAQVIEAVVGEFQKRHGLNAVPVTTTGESKDIEHFGKLGIVVPRSLKAILATKLDTFDSIKEKLAKETTKVYSWSELDAGQRKVLGEAMDLIILAVPSAGLCDVDVADFHDPKIEGMFKDGRVLVASRMLATVRGALTVLVHEYAHKQGGGDGDKPHIEHVENIWATIVTSLWG